MASDRLPVTVSSYGPMATVALHIHDLTSRGHHQQTVVDGERAEVVVGLLGDERTARMIRLARMYALVSLGRLDEALTLGEGLTRSVWGPRSRDWSTIAAGLSVTLSMGLTACVEGLTGPELYDRADKQLYAAKRSGRDQMAA